MRHQRRVVSVISADVLEAVAELLPHREVLLETGQAAGERLAPCIDDLRIRQRHVYQPEMHEIVGHLVDEERGPELAVDARALEILFAEPAPLLFGERGRHAWVSRT